MKKNLLILLVIFSQVIFLNSSIAGEIPGKEKLNHVDVVNKKGHYCFVEAANYYSINVFLLISIAEVESGMNSKAIGLNRKNGKVLSEDVGLMQINSSWFPFLEKNWGITRSDLLNDPCRNIYVGAYILAKNISSNGVNWESVGAYNAGFKEANAPFRMKYAKKVYDKFLAYQYRNHTEVINLASNGMRTSK